MVDPLGARRVRDGRLGADDRGVGLEEDQRLGGRRRSHLLGVVSIVLADAHDLRRQDGREETHVGQRPLPAGELGGTERVLGDLGTGQRGGVGDVPTDLDEGEPLRMGDTGETHTAILGRTEVT